MCRPIHICQKTELKARWTVPLTLCIILQKYMYRCWHHSNHSTETVKKSVAVLYSYRTSSAHQYIHSSDCSLVSTVLYSTAIWMNSAQFYTHRKDCPLVRTVMYSYGMNSAQYYIRSWDGSLVNTVLYCHRTELCLVLHAHQRLLIN